MIRPDAWVPLAEVARAHGVRGELRLRLFNKDSDVLLEQDEVLVRLTDGEEHEVSVDAARRADQAILMKLHSVDDRDRADELRGALVCVRREAFPPLDDGEFYTCDALGAEVVLVEGATDTSDPPESGAQRLGHVRDLMSYPSVDVLVVRAEDGGPDWEIPLVAAYIARADVAAGRFVLRSLERIERLAPRAREAGAAAAEPDDGP
ncbi:MAG TPA: ribosome maturation factor RimM [Polyangiaceae bacterium]|nr:ribosome maturation factor RimM [Polyangiaceae bacterium]